MAVVENAGVELGRSVGPAASNRAVEEEAAVVAGGGTNDQDQSKQNGQVRHRIDPSLHQSNNGSILRPHDQGLYLKVVPSAQVGFDHGAKISGAQLGVGPVPGPVHHHHHQHQQQQQQRSNGGDLQMNGDHVGESFNRDMRELRELFSKLNPMAEEFVPPSLANNNHGGFNNSYALLNNNNNGNRNGNVNGFNGRRVLTLSFLK